MAGLRLGGLASGMDTESVIAQLMALEAAPKTRFAEQQRRAEGRKTAVEDVARQLRALSSAVADLHSTLTWANVQKLESSDATKVAARVTGTAPAGTHSIDVTQMARVEQRTFTYAETADGGGMPQAQQITIDGVAVDIPAGTSQQGVVDAINAKSGITVYAGLVNGSLTLTGKTLGQTMAVTSSSGSVTEDASKRVNAQLTQYSINGVAQTPTTASTVQPGGLPGVELTLKAVTATPVSLSIGAPAADPDVVKTKIKAFVDAYNSATDLIRSKLAEKPVGSPTSTSQYVQGALRSDVALTGMLTRLRQTVTGSSADATPGVIDRLAELGVSVPASTGGVVSADGRIGKLVIDDAKLTAALTSDLTAVKNVLGAGGSPGIGQALATALEPVTKTGTGYLARASTAADADAARMKTRTADFDKLLALKEKRLRAQFTAMETALNASQAQSAWLQGQLGGLPSSNS